MAPGSVAALLAVLAASPLWILLTHVVLSRLLRRTAPQLVAVGAGLAATVPTALLARMLAFAEPSTLVPVRVAIVYGVVVYACIAYSYFHVFNMSETARRIRILREIHAAGSLSAQEILGLYPGASVLETRFDRLVATRQLEVEGGRFVRAGGLLYLAACLVRAWRHVLGFERRDTAAVEKG